VGLKGMLKWQIQKIALKNADAIITDSESSKKDIVKFVDIPPFKIHVVYLAASSEFIKLNNTSMLDSIKMKYKLPDKFVLYVGDATWNKNLPRLIEAASKINVPLAMVGKTLIDKKIDMKNPWNKDLVKVWELAEKNKNVFRLGFVSSKDLVALYNAATLFVMPSIYEGFGLPILEAMSCGCPVITSKEGSIPEIAEDACRYVNAYGIDNIAQGISEVFNNKNLQEELSKKGLIRSKKFTWEKTAEETVRVYKSIT
jgi:glycosyltransferase involved in cell wall biosynthesis